MRRLSAEARELLFAATEVARFRGAQRCEAADISVAHHVLSLHPGVSLYADASTSTSPEPLPFADELESLLADPQGVEVDIAELHRLAGVGDD